MRKNINRLVAFAIGISVMSGASIPVLAADSTTTASNSTTATSTQNATTTVSGQTQTNNNMATGLQTKMKPVLTLETAISAGIANSSQLSLQVKKIKLEEDKLDIKDETIGDDNNEYDSQEIAVKQEKENKEFLEDQISQDITNQYNDIVAKEKELNRLNKELEISKKDLKDNELRKNLGLLTSTEMKTQEIKIKTSENTIKDKENKLKNAKDYFKVLTEKDLNDYILEQDANYEVLKIDGSVDAYFDKVIEKYFRYKEKNIQLTDDYIKDHKAKRPDKDDKPSKDDSRFHKDKKDELGNVIGQEFDSAGYDAAQKDYEKSWTDYGTYLQNKYNLSSSKVSLEEGKKNLKKGLKESYASLLDLENNINVMKSNLEVANKKLSQGKLNLDMGLITKAQYNKQVLESDASDAQLRTLIDNYNKLKNNIQKPWLMGNSTGV